MKYVTGLVALVSIGSIVYGMAAPGASSEFSDKFIGFGTLGLFLVAMPLFLFRESRGKNAKDYMLTKENILKMRTKDAKKTENQ